MNAQIVRRLSPEEEELARKREELAPLQARLAERELFLANLRAELSAFEGQYLRQVGAVYAELDERTAKIAELLAEEEGTEEVRSAAAQARTQAEESGSAIHGDAAKVQAFLPSAELKALYREVAKRVHPDLATDEPDPLLSSQLELILTSKKYGYSADAIETDGEINVLAGSRASASKELSQNSYAVWPAVSF
jgi:chromosome segregation ATPase